MLPQRHRVPCVLFPAQKNMVRSVRMWCSCVTATVSAWGHTSRLGPQDSQYQIHHQSQTSTGQLHLKYGPGACVLHADWESRNTVRSGGSVLRALVAARLTQG